VAYEQLEN